MRPFILHMKQNMNVQEMTVPICCQIEIYESALKNIASAVVAAAAAVVFGYGSCVQVVRSAEIISARTLVSLRVKLSN